MKVCSHGAIKVDIKEFIRDTIQVTLLFVALSFEALPRVCRSYDNSTT